MRNAYFSLSVWLFGLALCALPVASGFDQKTSNSKSSDKSIDAGSQPMTIDMVSRAVDSVKKKRLKESRVLELLEQHNVSFKATPENLKKLADAGASTAILDKLKQLAPPQPPPEIEPKKPAFSLLVKCTPMECEVRVNNDPFKPTTSGLISFTFLGAQRVIVDARRDGYAQQEMVYNIDPAKAVPGKPFEQTFELVPNAATQTAWGEQWYAKVTADLPKGNQHTLSGQLIVGGAQPEEWKVSGSIGRHGDAELQFENNQGRYSASCSAFICSRSAKSGRSPSMLKGSKQEKAQQEGALLRHAQAFLVQEYSAFATNLTNGKLEALSKSDPAKPGEEKHLEVKNALGLYRMQLDDGSRPASVAFSPSANLLLVSKVNYSNFRKLSDGWYPATTEFVIPGDTNAISFTVKDINAAP